MTGPQLQHQFIKDISVSRRKILRGAAGGMGAASAMSLSQIAAASNHSKPLQQSPFELVSSNFSSRANDQPWGMAMSYGSGLI